MSMGDRTVAFAGMVKIYSFFIVGNPPADSAGSFLVLRKNVVMKQIVSRRSVFAVGVVFVMCLLGAVNADVSVPPCFSDHMVLQRDMAVPVWGSAGAGEAVTVTFRGQARNTVADANGKWTVRLDPLSAGGPDDLIIAGANTITLTDVLVGEVWVGSGQSNMAGGAHAYAAKDDVLAAALQAAPYPRLRLLKGQGGGWVEGTQENATRFSALLFSFGLPLQQELDVPVGLILGAVGGTPSGRWLTQEMIESDAACRAALDEFASRHTVEEMQKNHEQAMANWEKAVAVAKEQNKRTPRKPQPAIIPGDVEGRQIGDLYAQHIAPVVGYGIRGVLWDQGESGTAVPELDQFIVMGALIAGWRKAWNQPPPVGPGSPATEFPFLYVQKPSGGGCAWDTENDPITRMADAFTPPVAPAHPGDNGLYRELHIKIMQHPGAAMVTASDLGSGVHPLNKSGYGARAARVALGMVYGRDVAICGPLYKSHAIENGKVRVAFSHVGQGLAFKHGEKLQGFTVAGEDKVFKWADAVIEADTVVVSSVDVPGPVAVRYGWARNHPWANLFNKDGLPALTFRTDDW